MMPAHNALTQSGPLRTPVGAAVSAEQARGRLSPRKNALNRALRKYSLNATSQRLGLFFAQTVIETDRWKTFREYGQGAANPNIPMAQYYAAFYGRGALQLTWADAYEKYGQFRRFSDTTGAYADPRITHTSTPYWSDPTTRDAQGHITGVIGIPKRWAPHFDPDVVASDVVNACDSASFFWVWKHHSGTRNINRVADRQFSASVIDRVNKLVNGGGFGYFERVAYSYYTRHILSDWVYTTNMLTVDTENPHIRVRVDLSRPT